MGVRRVYHRDVGALDGLITDVTNLANGSTAYTYVSLMREGYLNAIIEHIISNTTLTIEMCNVGEYTGGAGLVSTNGTEANGPLGLIRPGIATASDGSGATLTDSGLATPFPTDTDLNQIQVRITADKTTPSNVGLTRLVTSYTGATGVMTLSSAFGAVTSGVTQYQLEDNPSYWGRLVSDPTSSQWRDVTTLLTGAASHTASGTWMFDTRLPIERFRIKRVPSNASNSLQLRLTRGR